MNGDKRTNNGNPVGAVMVVGGGIAGIQASLDLAEQGFKVYLVEAKSAIGGHMAQLDKTFPTNDCAMCTLAPKLVEASRHLNIEILVDTEVMGLRGEAGNFTATLRRKPRYIDPAKCVGCGDCAAACPVPVPDAFNVNLNPRRAAYKLYPQAVPNAYAIEKRGVSPCRDACPIHQRAQGYIALIREGRYADAYRTIVEDNPFPAICGRVCNHRCEDACSRSGVDAPVSIMRLKRFVADWANDHGLTPSQWLDHPNGSDGQVRGRIAVVGAGPAGLTCARDLIARGYAVTVFEALPVPGGMMRVGVPAYRLPRDLVEKEIQAILDLGVDLRLNSRVEDVEALLVQGYDAVFVAIGAHVGKKLPIPGADHPDVLDAVEFLRRVSLGEPVRLGQRVLVLGGGNVAIDAAMTARRLGASQVRMACLESRETMPAHDWEIAQAEAEGVEVFPARSFTRILNADGRITGVECVDVSFMAFDEDGRLTLETVPDSEHVIEADTVIFAIGQGVDAACLNGRVDMTRRRTVAVDPDSLATSRPGIFAGGDAVTGTAFIVDAIAAGHKAARSIDAYVQSGQSASTADRQENKLPVARLSQAEAWRKIIRGQASQVRRGRTIQLPPGERITGFQEIEQGFTEEQARAEAQRCLACGICSECLQCVYACRVEGAILHDMVERIEEIKVGAVVLAPGYQVYHAELSQEFGFGRYPNVVTSLQFERLLSASGPTNGHVRRPSDGATPRKIAFLQCVGSRDRSHDYCSAVCCMYAAKEAIMAVEHEPDTECHVFMMDMRAFGKGYEEYYHRARNRYGVKYTRCRISEVKEDPRTRNLILRYVPSDKGAGVVEEEFDLVVLSVGMEMSEQVKQLGRDLGIELDDYGFCRTVFFDPLQTSRPGVYAVGPFREPKDIPDTVVDASGGAARSASLLAASRGALSRHVQYPPERDVSGEPPRIGVFVCHCGNNIGGFLDVPAVAEYALTLPGVVHSEHNLYTCSQDSISRIIERVKELNLNRVVVASCSPRLLGPTFQETVRQAGLNPYLFEMANIRNQCSWVHSNDWDGATRKAKDLVRMAVARAARLDPLHTHPAPVEQSALVIGGGAAGMNAALALADQGFPVHLVERSAELGGNLRHLFYTPPIDSGAMGVHSLEQNRDPQRYLRELIARVQSHPLIHVYRRTELVETTGFVGNFTSRLRGMDGGNGDGGEGVQEFLVRHGVTIVATGGQEYRGDEYLYGQDPRILTQQQFEALLAGVEAMRSDGDRSSDRGVLPNSVVMIQCVGPAEKYCARICCTTALKNALKLKQLNPDAQVVVLYKDIRTYGFRESLYSRARDAGVLFVRYDDDHRPEVRVDSTGALAVQAWEPVLGQMIAVAPDLVVLSTPVVPAEGVRELGAKLKAPVDADGFFLEAHVKLRPVDFASAGLFMAGLAHYPKFLEESIVQAQAAAARAATILAKENLPTGGVVAQVDPSRCTACLTCVRVCPYGAPRIVPSLQGAGGIMGAAAIEAAMCQGCGICAAECPAKAIQLLHYRDDQVLSKVDALFLAPVDLEPVPALESTGR